jgi:hypothetical protein
MRESVEIINSRRREVIGAFSSSFDAGAFQWQSSLFLLLRRNWLAEGRPVRTADSLNLFGRFERNVLSTHHHAVKLADFVVSVLPTSWVIVIDASEDEL